MNNTQIISVINQKGGVGKTTTVINLATALSFHNKKVLVIDLDPQGNATTGLGMSNTENSNQTIYSVLNGTKNISEVIQKTKFNNLDLITSNVDLSGLEIEIAGDNRRAFILKEQIMAYLNDSGAIYSYILIDCPPSLSLLTIMALVASNSLLIPLQCEFFALQGLSELVKTIDTIKESTNKSINIKGIIRTMFDPRNNLTTDVSKQLLKHFPGKVFKTINPRNVTLAEAPSHGLPVLDYDKHSKGSFSYLSLVGEIIKQEK